MNRLVLALFAVVIVGQVPGSAALPDEQITRYPKPKSPDSELVQVPEPKTGVTGPQALRIEVSKALEVRTFTPRIVCGMKMIEGTADMDPRIIKPIPERPNAKIRVLGPPPCADAPPAAPDRR